MIWIILPILALLAYFLFVRTSYSGAFSFSMDDQSYKWKVEKVEQHKSGSKTIYSIRFSDKTNYARVTFSLLEEDGDIWMQLDNPTIHLNGNIYTPIRPLRRNDYNFDYYGNSLCVVLWNVPYSGGFRLNGDFDFSVSNSELT